MTARKVEKKLKKTKKLKELKDFPQYFINRELSWCEFNHRVLEEAMDARNPLLERFRFASIVASNLDEFFMVRVAALRNKAERGDRTRDTAGLSAEETLNALAKRIHLMAKSHHDTLRTLLNQAAKQGIRIRSMGGLNERQLAMLERRFENEIFPVLTPMAIDLTHPFPILLNLSLNIAIRLDGKVKEKLAIVPIPTGLPRLLYLPESRHEFVLLEEVIRHHLPELFAGQDILEAAVFRITRDAELELEEDTTADIVMLLESELRSRRTNPVVRFEVEAKISDEFLSTFSKLLEISDKDIYRIPQFVDPRFVSQLAESGGRDDLLFPPQTPHMPVEVESEESIFPLLNETDIVLHHPYESFDPVVRLVAEAADDPDVLAIKQTLYRTSGNSPIIRALARAAQNGKQVAVLVELLARFDEERNITWAKQLELAGVHVIYGLVGLKVHAKILLIVRRDRDGIKRYVHLGTGNYNDRTARLYTDVSLMTSDEAIGADASRFFNTITGYSDPPEFQKLSMAPVGLRQEITSLIRREAERARSGQRAAITAKMNSLVDPDIISELYLASQAGVKIQLAVRGICCLRPGLKGISERITVVSIVDRYLEHSRIFYFYNGGEEEFFCSSADWMPRNLDRRVELFFPVTSDYGRKVLRTALDLFFADNTKARVLQTDGTYHYKKQRKNEPPVSYQLSLYKSLAQSRAKAGALQFKPRKTRAQEK